MALKLNHCQITVKCTAFDNNKLDSFSCRHAKIIQHILEVVQYISDM